MGKGIATTRWCVARTWNSGVKWVVVLLGDEADWKITACEGGVVSIGSGSEMLPAEEPMPAKAVNGVLGKTGAEWKMTACVGGVVSISSISELLPA